MTARTLEANGIATVVIGSAHDILVVCGTPRVVYNDLPLGNPVGRPFDRAMQRATVEQALRLLETTTTPGAFEQTAFRWAQDDAWKANYMRIDDPEALRAAGAALRAERAANREKGLFRA